MSPGLEALLFAEDLDELLHARNRITTLDHEDQAVVRAVVREWRNAQAVSNLLFHPDLIPADLRLPKLLRGLSQRQVAYYVLAAVVGFQSLDTASLAEADRLRVLSDLLAVIRNTTGILAQRSSVSFQRFAKAEEAPQLFDLLGHSDTTVRHNARAWLFRTFQVAGIEQLSEVCRQSGIGAEVQRQVIAEFADFVVNPPPGLESPVFSLYGYIPNLADFRQ